VGGIVLHYPWSSRSSSWMPPSSTSRCGRSSRTWASRPVAPSGSRGSASWFSPRCCCSGPARRSVRPTAPVHDRRGRVHGGQRACRARHVRAPLRTASGGGSAAGRRCPRLACTSGRPWWLRGGSDVPVRRGPVRYPSVPAATAGCFRPPGKGRLTSHRAAGVPRRATAHRAGPRPVSRGVCAGSDPAPRGSARRHPSDSPEPPFPANICVLPASAA